MIQLRQSLRQWCEWVEKKSVARPSRIISSVGPWPMVLPARGNVVSNASAFDQVRPSSVLRETAV